MEKKKSKFIGSLHENDASQHRQLFGRGDKTWRVEEWPDKGIRREAYGKMSVNF